MSEYRRKVLSKAGSDENTVGILVIILMKGS